MSRSNSQKKTALDTKPKEQEVVDIVKIETDPVRKAQLEMAQNLKKTRGPGKCNSVIGNIAHSRISGKIVALTSLVMIVGEATRMLRRTK